MFLTLNFTKIGLRISGVIRSSINHFTNAQTFAAIKSQIAIPTTLY